MTADMLSQEISLLLPEILLAGGAMVLLMLGVFMEGERATRLVYTLSILALIGAALLALFGTGGEGTAFGGAFVFDPLAKFSKVAIALVAALTLTLALPYLDKEKLLKIEYPILAILAATGMGMMVSSQALGRVWAGQGCQARSAGSRGCDR